MEGSVERRFLAGTQRGGTRERCGDGKQTLSRVKELQKKERKCKPRETHSLSPDSARYNLGSERATAQLTCRSSSLRGGFGT